MIPLATPNLTGNEKAYLDRCIETTFVSSVGEYVNTIEERMAALTGAKMAIATSSGTTALHTALLTVGVNRDELVIMPTFTFIATANAIAHCGAIPYMCDVERENWTLDADAVRNILETETKLVDRRVVHKRTGMRIAAIVPVYTLGNPPDMDKFKDISEEYCIPVVADAAAALGADYHGQNLADLATLTAFSFNGNKTFTAGGGGMVVGNDENLLTFAKHISTTARVSTEYDHDVVGYNYRMTNLQAAVGCAQLERFEEFVAKKRYIREFYANAFAGMEDIETFAPSIWGNSACWFSGIVQNFGSIEETRDFCAYMKEKGIESRSFWKPIHMQAPYRDAARSESLVVAESTWSRIATLPCSTGITDEELNQVADAVKGYFH